jgi:hypothetical protein
VEYSTVVFGSTAYTLVVTVPLSDIQAQSVKITQSIQSALNGMIAAFVIVLFFFAAFFVFFARALIQSVVGPVTALSDLCVKVNSDDLSSKLGDARHGPADSNAYPIYLNSYVSSTLMHISSFA